MEEKNLSRLEEIIRRIEKKYGTSYSSINFSRAVFLFLRSGGVSLYEMHDIMTRYLLDVRYEVTIAEMKRGNVYHFPYNPKDKKVEYFDRTPCIVYLGKTRDSQGFYGLNLNYLHPILRHDVVTRLPYYKNELVYENYAKTLDRVSKRIKVFEVDVQFGYIEAKTLYRREYKHIIKRYSNNRLQDNPVPIGIKIAKLVSMFDIHSFNKRNPYPLWKKVMGSIIKTGGI